VEIGVGFPQEEFGADCALLRDYIQTVEGLGYDHIVLLEHVVGADPDRPGGWSQPYDVTHQFHEPLVFLAWVAAQTTRLGLMTGILILPQRQTALVAKQATEVAILSGGRLRLGVGAGWNEVEYEAMGSDFSTRGRRLDAQIPLLRRLWSEPVVEAFDRWHSISRAGISPRPPKPIPIWVGGMSEAALRRAARLADGWYPLTVPVEQAQPMIDRLHHLVRAAGRDPNTFGVEGRLNIGGPDLGSQIDEALHWETLGVPYLAVTTRRPPHGPKGETLAIGEHFQALRRFREAWASVRGVRP
jgi:probable F420-dependent oxidoreductase